eukprot:TRINITY_DN3323_c0_g1_i1.p1 TRINITY_DN3323_c0_g1~~TRINITY_DN3323_c0_g1_i1.p1  ORF type:complete len:236 (+),score=67.71 TRINITY_DN3323_c0_g1_i1:31-738(+)
MLSCLRANVFLPRQNPLSKYFSLYHKPMQQLSKYKITKPTSLVFLDIDGVIYTPRHDGSIQKRVKERFKGKEDQLILDGYSIPSRECDKAAVDFFDEVAVKHLDLLISEMKELTRQDVGIVISSCWRIGYSVDELRELFGQHRFGESVIGMTPQLMGRSNEISSWITTECACNLSSYLILDDIDWGFSKLFPQQFVQCDTLFNEKIYHKALSLLKAQLECEERSPAQIKREEIRK